MKRESFVWERSNALRLKRRMGQSGRSYGVAILPTIRAGLPAATEKAGTSLVTTEPAPNTMQISKISLCAYFPNGEILLVNLFSQGQIWGVRINYRAIKIARHFKKLLLQRSMALRKARDNNVFLLSKAMKASSASLA